MTGQVNQKILGISKIQKEIPWVLFLDDDLLLEPQAMEKAFETLAKFRSVGEDVLGIGLGLTPTSRMKRTSHIQNFIGRVLRLSSGTPGKVIRSGQGVSYLESSKPIYTEWLNGASMWKTESALDYTNFVPSSSYAACEDLVFAPDAKVLFQDTEPNDYNRSQAIISSTAWRYFFVKSNPELSKWQLMYSQLGRLAYILVTQSWNQDAVRAGIWSVKHLFVSVASDKEPMYLINKIS
jgi:hypothetical protein